MSKDSEPKSYEKAWQMLESTQRLSRTVFLQRASNAPPPVWQPEVDVFESDRTVLVVVALAGVAKEAIELKVQGNELIVSGSRARPASCQGGRVRQLEIPKGRFERRIEMPEGRFKLARKELADGCLLVRLSRIG